MAKKKYTLKTLTASSGASGTFEWSGVDKGIFVATRGDGFEEVKDHLYQEQTQLCIRYGREKLQDAFALSDYKDQTGNLSDSYVFGVYFNGKLVHSEHFRPQLATKEVKVTGTEETQSGSEQADKFIKSYSPRRNKGWEIVWAATMFYGGYLENGTSRNKKYVVISAILDDVNMAFGANNADCVVTMHAYTPQGYGY